MNERIFELLAQKGLKMQHLAAELGTKDSRVYDWKREKTKPNPDEFGKIAKVLNTTEAYLRGETDDPRPEDQQELDELEWAMLDASRDLTDEQKRTIIKMIKALKD